MNNKNPLILWVDDDFSLRILAERVLLKAGFDCVTAGSGQEALVLLSKITPDLILLDVEMPGMDGFKTCAAIRQNTVSKDIPILTVTCHDDFESIGRAFDTGATDFMTKPLNWKLLVYRVQYMLRSDHIVKKLKQCKSRLHNVQKIAQIGTWEWNNETKKMYFSPEACQVFGWPYEQSISYQQFLDRIHPEDKQDFVDKTKFTADDGAVQSKSFSIEHRIIHTDGSIRYVFQHGELSRQGSDQLGWITSAIQDISERILAEQSLDSQVTINH